MKTLLIGYMNNIFKYTFLMGGSLMVAVLIISLAMEFLYNRAIEEGMKPAQIYLNFYHQTELTNK